MDVFQERYLNHQERKTKSLEEKNGVDKIDYSVLEKTTLKEIMINRRSQRIFNDEKIIPEDFRDILLSVKVAPSSCNRQAIYLKEIEPMDAEVYLVGGKKWIDKAYRVFLLFGSKEAYKSINEIGFMPFLDAGFVGQNIYLMCEALGIGCCYVNPNIREENKQSFIDKYGDDYFCGAVALGKYDKKSKKPPLRDIIEVLRK